MKVTVATVRDAWSWLEIANNSAAILAVVTTVLAVLALLAFVANIVAAVATLKLVKATRALKEHEVAEAKGEHGAAVQAVFHELAAVEKLVRYRLKHGTMIEAGGMFGFVRAYSQVLIQLHRGMPVEVSVRVAQTYSMMAVMQPGIETGSTMPIALLSLHRPSARVGVTRGKVS
jgi:hypothetical protein